MIDRIVDFWDRYVNWIAAALAVGLLTLAVNSARADEPKTLGQDDPPPDATLIVTQCGEPVVLWIFYNGNIIRADAQHHPDSPQEYNAFAQWAMKSSKTDLYEIPCNTPKPKEKS